MSINRQACIIQGLHTLYTRTYQAYDEVATELASIYRIGETPDDHPLVVKKEGLAETLSNIAFRMSLVDVPVEHHYLITWEGNTRIRINYTVSSDGTVFAQNMTPGQLEAFSEYIQFQRNQEKGPHYGASLSVASPEEMSLWYKFLETLHIEPGEPDEDETLIVDLGEEQA